MCLCVLRGRGKRGYSVHMRADRYKTKSANKTRRVVIVLLLFVIAAAAAFLPSGFGNIRSKIVIEAGSEVPPASAFIKKPGENVYPVTDTSSIDGSVPGTYPVIIKNWLFMRTVNLVIEDTTPPTADAKQVTCPLGKKTAAEDMVENVQDVTKVDIRYASEPDFSKPGPRSVDIILEDTSGNKTRITSTLDIIEDTTPPQIHGAKTHTLRVGETISYKKGVTVTDDADPSPVLTVDNTAVDLDKAGTYPVTYTATDFSGNSSSVSVNIRVEDPPSGYEEIDKLYDLADKLVAEIITDDMNEIEKAFAIFKWTRTKIPFTYENVPHNYVDQAIRGLQGKIGDCYTCSAAAKTLFERAGFEAIFMEKPTHSHYWLMVKVNGEWYYMEPTPIYLTTFMCFLGTDAQLEWFNKHVKEGYYTFNHKLYPAPAKISPAEVKYKNGEYTLIIKDANGPA